MTTVPKKVSERLVAGVKQFQPILESAKSRDLNEADTVTIVKDMLAGVFGYDKYAELTSEFAIRGNYCDLATRLDGVIATLIEVKAVGIDLKDHHVRQAVDYAANQGVEWVLLTNGIAWRVYRVQFSKPIEHELVVDVNFCQINPRSPRDIESLYLWCKEGWVRSVLGDYAAQKEALSRYFLGALMLTDPVLDLMRRELRRISPDVRIETDEIKTVLINEVIKREVLEGDKADGARKKIAKSANISLRAMKAKDPAPACPELSADVAKSATA
jgi:type I restriction and modification enzyme subunit R-like protein